MVQHIFVHFAQSGRVARCLNKRVRYMYVYIVCALMVRNYEIDEANQHALSYIESSEVFLSLVRIFFFQNV